MYCPHCDKRVPDGSNICIYCGGRINGVPAGAQGEDGAKKAKAHKKTTAYAKGSRRRKSGDKAPMIIAFGLIVLLVVIIVMIMRSMFGVGGMGTVTPSETSTPAPRATPEGGFIIFGATDEPTRAPVVTPEIQIEVTPTPAPEQPQAVSYKTLRKGDQGTEVVAMQLALVELGYLTGASDGNFGTGTQTAVKNFQKDNGLDADGIAGKMTLEKLFGLSSVTPIPKATVAPGDILDLPG